MSALADRVAQFTNATKDAMYSLAADVEKLEADIRVEASSTAQQALADATASSQQIIAATKKQAEDALALARQEFEAEKQAALAAQQADFNKQLAASSAKTAKALKP